MLVLKKQYKDNPPSAFESGASGSTKTSKKAILPSPQKKKKKESMRKTAATASTSFTSDEKSPAVKRVALDTVASPSDTGAASGSDDSFTSSVLSALSSVSQSESHLTTATDSVPEMEAAVDTLSSKHQKSLDVVLEEEESKVETAMEVTENFVGHVPVDSHVMGSGSESHVSQQTLTVINEVAESEAVKDTLDTSASSSSFHKSCDELNKNASVSKVEMLGLESIHVDRSKESEDTSKSSTAAKDVSIL